MTITYEHVRATVSDAQGAMHTTPVRILLSPQAVMGLAGERSGLIVRCHTGHVWLTQEGDATDRALSTGDGFRVLGKGRIVLQALDEAVVSVSPAEG